MEGNYDNKGEVIDYKALMEKFRDLKSWLKNRIEEQLKHESIQQGVKISSTKQERETFGEIVAAIRNEFD